MGRCHLTIFRKPISVAEKNRGEVSLNIHDSSVKEREGVPILNDPSECCMREYQC